MTGTEVNEVVDKLADKIGVAADKLIPVAETAIQQVSNLGLAYVTTGVLCLLSLYFVAFRGLQARLVAALEHADPEKQYSPLKDGGARMASIVTRFVIGAGLLGCGIAGIANGLPRWLSPIVYLIK